MVPPKSSFVSSTYEAIINTHHIGYADAFLLLLNSIEIGILLPLAYLCGYRIGQSKKAQTRRDGLDCDVRGATGSGWIESYVFTSVVTSCGSTFMYVHIRSACMARLLLSYVRCGGHNNNIYNYLSASFYVPNR